MAVNKLIIDDVVELDLTADTVTADTLTEGVTAHDASGTSITGTLAKVTVDEQLSNDSANPVQNKAIKNALDDMAQSVSSLTPTILTDTLPQGATTLFFEDDSITDGASIYVETSVWNVYPTSAYQESNQVTFTFEAQSIDVTVKVYVCED